MRTDDVVSLFGTAKALADFLEITESAVSQWGKEVPRLRQYELREKRPSIDKEIQKMRAAA
jgi:DNA-binding transcriptional regulator YdaS (Cro superfamily)